jgi:hypothetical protein
MWPACVHTRYTRLLLFFFFYEDADAEWTDTMLLQQLQEARTDAARRRYARKPSTGTDEGSLLRLKIQELENKLRAIAQQSKFDRVYYTVLEYRLTSRKPGLEISFRMQKQKSIWSSSSADSEQPWFSS